MPKVLIILFSFLIFGFSSKPVETGKLVNVAEIKTLKYFYGLRIPADPNDEECGTPLDVALRRVEIDLEKKRIDIVWWDLKEMRNKTKYGIPLGSKEHEKIKLFLSSLKFDSRLKEKFEKQEGYASSEEIYVRYDLERNPNYETYHLYTGEPLKDIRKMELFETEATLFFKRFIEGHLDSEGSSS